MSTKLTERAQAGTIYGHFATAAMCEGGSVSMASGWVAVRDPQNRAMVNLNIRDQGVRVQ